MSVAKALRGRKGLLLAASGVALAGVLALTVWQQGRGSTSASLEPFRSFQNQTRFSNEEVWRAYRFGAANPGGVLNYIPCFCGCGAFGHTSNHDCYVKSVDGQGRPTFDPHAAG